MKSSDNLYLLIRSLSASEKRYFKIFSQRHLIGGQNKYDKLFDIYDGLGEEGYDEKALLPVLTKKGFGKNLSDHKKNLQEMIMRAMLNYHSGETVDQQLNDLLAEEDFYRQKRLNGLRAKAIARAKEIAEKYDRPMIMLQLLVRENMMRIEIEQDRLPEIAEGLDTERLPLLDRITITSDLSALNNWLFIQYRLGSKRDEALWERVAVRMSIPAFRDYRPGLSFLTDRSYYSAWTFYYLLRGDHAAYHQYVKLQYELYELHHPQQKDNARVLYKIALFNYVYSLQQTGDFDGMKALLDHAATIEPMNEDDAGESFQNLVFYRQLYYMNTGRFAEAAAMTSEIEHGIRKYRRKVNKSRELTLYSNIAISCMMIEDWDRVVDYTEKIITDKTDVRMDIRHEAMLHQLIARYEMQQYDLLSYQCRNLQRTLGSRGQLHDSHAYILRQLNLLLKNGPDHWDTLRKNSEEALASCQHHTPVKAWLHKHIHKVTMSTAAAVV